MTKEEFKKLSKDDKLIQIIYYYDKGKVEVKYFPYRFYKNFGHFSRDKVNKYNNHCIAMTSSNDYEMWCTEDKLDIALENMKNILIKREKEIISKAETNIQTIKNSKIVNTYFE